MHSERKTCVKTKNESECQHFSELWLFYSQLNKHGERISNQKEYICVYSSVADLGHNNTIYTHII